MDRIMKRSLPCAMLVILLLCGGGCSNSAERARAQLERESDALAAQEPDLPDLRSMPDLNGLDPAVADRFWDRWHMVTVRYRTDNTEQRFVYANDIAWKAYLQHQKVFPEGSMLAKIAFKTEDDRLFPVSREPAHWTRIQLMKKNSQGFEKFGGWQYSLYVPEKIARPTFDPKEVVACHACHIAATSRDYIFSKPAFIPNDWIDDPQSSFADRFVEKPRAELGEKALGILKSAGREFQFTRARFLEMPLFSGSLSESTPTIAKSVARYHVAYVLSDVDGKYLLAVVPEIRQREGCVNSVRVFHYEVRQAAPKPVNRSGTLCEGQELKWDPLPASK